MPYFSITAFAAGLPVGAAFCLTLGPVFFSLVRNSIEHGVRVAWLMATGVVVADLLLLTFAFSGVATLLPKDNAIAFWVEIFGAILLTILGIAAMVKKAAPLDTNAAVKRGSALRYIALGIGLNLLNPANFAEWTLTASYLQTTLHFKLFESISFFTGALLAVWLVEAAIGYFASRLRRLMTPHMVQRFNQAVGLVFLICAAALLGKAFQIF
jgi:threonine/homoserine/homoserine lactone efflux protein